MASRYRALGRDPLFCFKMTKRKKDSLLWQLTPREGGPVSYLFGTMHVRDQRAFTWLKQACACVDECEVFAVEFDFSQADPAATNAALTLPEGITLQQLLGRNAWKSLDFHCRKKLGVPPEVFQKAHPMRVQVALTQVLLSDEAARSLDETLWAYAKTMGKQLTGVETFEKQLEMLRNIQPERYAKNLTWWLKNYGSQRQRLRQMMRWYREGHLRQLYQAARRDARGLRRPLLLERNERMAKRFAEIARCKSLFCAVGAAHLAGGKGLLRLLKNAGFTVKPVPKRAL